MITGVEFGDGGPSTRTRFPPAAAPEAPRPLVWLLLYALAHGGGVVAYVPLITLLLPLKAQAVAGPGEAGFALLTLLTATGAVAAGVGNIVAGALSDRARGGSRRPFVWAGLGATLASYALVHGASDPAALVAAFVAFQLAVNLLLAPLAALAADETSDSQKGLLGGLLGAAYPLGALAGVAVTSRGLEGEGPRLVAIAVLVAAAVLPFLLLTRSPGAPAAPSVVEVAPAAAPRSSAFRRVWGARLLMQTAGAVLFSYMLLYFQSLPGAPSEGATAGAATLAGLAAVLTVPLSVALGWSSDRVGARKPFLVAGALAAAAGLLLLTFAPGWGPAAVGYAAFACANGVFLALQNAWAMQLLPRPDRRGLDLGLFNLTNTLPSLIAPPLALVAVRSGGYPLLFAGLTAFCLACAALTAVTSEKKAARRAA